MPTTQRTGKPRKGLAPLPAITPPETSLDALARLNDEAWRGILKSVPDIALQIEGERAFARLPGAVGNLHGRPDDLHPLYQARQHAERMVDRLIAFLDATAGEADAEDCDPGGGDINDLPHDDELDTHECCELDHYGESDGDFDLDASCLTVCEGCDSERHDGVEPFCEDEYGGHSTRDPRASEMAREQGKRALDKSLARGQRRIVGEGGRVTIVGPDFRSFLVTDLR